ncbi:hypothetical protein GCM10010872_02930 [Dyella flava]|nr:hypothetical protein GCM10010872_02930 [Dyella flava]
MSAAIPSTPTAWTTRFIASPPFDRSCPLDARKVDFQYAEGDVAVAGGRLAKRLKTASMDPGKYESIAMRKNEA